MNFEVALVLRLSGEKAEVLEALVDAEIDRKIEEIAIAFDNWSRLPFGDPKVPAKEKAVGLVKELVQSRLAEIKWSLKALVSGPAEKADPTPEA